MNAQLPHYVYRCYDAGDALIYVGCTADPDSRVESHRRRAWWGGQIARVEYTVYPDRATGLRHERRAIQEDSPRWNVRSRWASRAGWSRQQFADYLTAARAVPGTSAYAAEHLRRAEAEYAERFEQVAS